MKKRSIISIFLFIVLLCLWLLTKPNGFEPISPTNPVSPIESSPSPTHIPSPTATHIIPYGDEGVTRPPGMSNSDWERAQKVHAAIKSQNKIINFYGRIVDQNNIPVSGVDIELETVRMKSSLVTGVLGGTESSIHNLHSDENGFFKIEGEKGSSLSIKKLSKDGFTNAGSFYLRDDGNKNRYSYGNILGSPNSSEFHRPDTLNPVVFRMWKKGVPEGIAIRGKTVRFKYSGIENIINEEINLIPESSKSKIDKVMIDLSIISKGSNIIDVSFRGIGDIELIEAKDKHSNLAPDDGYQNLILLRVNKNYISDLRVYFRSKKEGFYGYCELSVFNFFEYPSGTNSTLRFDVYGLKINPNNSPNLEVEEK